MAGWSFLSLWPSWITYKLPALSNATSCVVCHEYFAGNCGQLCSASYLYSPLPTMIAESVFLAVRIVGTAATAAAPAATFKNSRRRIVDDILRSPFNALVRPTTHGRFEESQPCPSHFFSAFV